MYIISLVSWIDLNAHGTGCLYMETSNMAAILHIIKTSYFRSVYMCMKFE